MIINGRFYAFATRHLSQFDKIVVTIAWNNGRLGLNKDIIYL
jgi:hypothetical protein